MAGVIRYLLLANFFLIVLALFNHLVLSHETRFKTNRFVYLAGILLSLILPLFNFNWLPTGSYSLLTIPEIIVSAKSRMTHYDLEEIQIFGQAPFIFPWIKVITAAYLAGVLLAASIFLWEIKRIQYWTKSLPMKWFRNLYITIIPGEWNPFSFLGIVYYPQPFDKEDIKTSLILDHEKTHIIQRHSYDILLVEVVKIIFFYNPAIYTIKKQIQINHEFLADSSVSGENPKYYSQELIRSQMQVPQFQFIQQFNQTSFLKRRLIMIMKHKTNQSGLLKYFLLVPLVIALFWVTACTEEEGDSSLGIGMEKQMLDLNNDNYKSNLEVYAEKIFSSDYSEMNENEKNVKVVAVEMTKMGTSDQEVLDFMVGRLKLMAAKDKSFIVSSSLFKSTGLDIDKLEINTIKLKGLDNKVLDVTTEEGEVFYIVEEMPEFNGGGLDEFRNWVQENVKYPEIALENGISGTVYVSFIIDQEGGVSSIQLVRGVDPSLDDEVKRVLSSAPAWTPGLQRGKKVKVQMAIPVKFELQ